MGRATETEISALHGAINSLYISTAKELLDGLSSPDAETRAAAASLVSPAMLTSMANWVKQNNVTCQPEETEEISDLAAQLRSKRKRSKTTVLKLAEVKHG